MSTALAVDDEKLILRRLDIDLRARGFDVERARAAAQCSSSRPAPTCIVDLDRVCPISSESQLKPLGVRPGILSVVGRQKDRRIAPRREDLRQWSVEDLRNRASLCAARERTARFSKARRSWKRARLMVEEELARREGEEPRV